MFVCFCTHRKGSSESNPGSVFNAHNNCSMTSPTMVSGASKNVRKNPNTSTSIQRSPERASKKVKSTRNAEFFAASCLDNHRTCLQKEGLSTLWPTVGYVQSALQVNLEEVVWSPSRTDMIY